MFHYTVGNLLESKATALVNTVNTVGVMGKGIALQFKEAYPHNYAVYRKACKNESLHVGALLVTMDSDVFGSRIIVNFPTKQHWRSPSTYGFVKDGLIALRTWMEKSEVKSIAIPPLGCGNGGLDWVRVRAMIEEELAGLPADIYLYEPNPLIHEQLKAKHTVGKKLELTPARAMLLHALFHYEEENDPISLFVAQKLAYFLQLLGQPMRLKFQKYYYGPYSPQMNPFVRTFNGSYLRGMEQATVRPFDPLPLNYDRYPMLAAYVESELSAKQKDILQRLDQLLTGYKSAYPLEILATVAWIHQEHPHYGVTEIIAEAEQWSNRKKYLLQEEHVQLALNRLLEYETGALALSV
ncbi:MAG: macro domain-containing protein [Saprospiraceae bacterium]